MCSILRHRVPTWPVPVRLGAQHVRVEGSSTHDRRRDARRWRRRLAADSRLRACVCRRCRRDLPTRIGSRRNIGAGTSEERRRGQARRSEGRGRHDVVDRHQGGIADAISRHECGARICPACGAACQSRLRSRRTATFHRRPTRACSHQLDQGDFNIQMQKNSDTDLLMLFSQPAAEQQAVYPD